MVEREPERRPAMKRPGIPGKSPNVSTTKRGRSWKWNDVNQTEMKSEINSKIVIFEFPRKHGMIFSLT
jgi:hypothetical protein